MLSVPASPVMMVAFCDDSTTLDETWLPSEGGFRAPVDLEAAEGGRFHRGMEALLSGGVGFPLYSVFDTFEEDRVPFAAVNAPFRAIGRAHSGTSRGPGLDAPGEAQYAALEEAVASPWRALVALIRGPLPLRDVRWLLEMGAERFRKRPVTFLVALPSEGDGEVLVLGPGVRDQALREHVSPESVTATALLALGCRLPRTVAAHPLPAMKVNTEEAERSYVTL